MFHRVGTTESNCPRNFRAASSPGTSKEAPAMLQVHDPLPIGPAADRLEYARQVVRAEAVALDQVAGRLGDSFLQAIDLVYHCPGRIAVTGTGKSSDVG